MSEGKTQEERGVTSELPMLSHHTLLDYFKLALIILAVILIGLLAINQAFEWQYKNYFLKAPCQLCEELNPHLSQCFEEASIYYTDLEGNVIENITKYKRDYWNVTLPTS